MAHVTESTVESAALAWLESLGWSVKHGAEIAPCELFAERQDYTQVVLAERLRQALVRLNPSLPADAIKDARRRITRPRVPPWRRATVPSVPNVLKVHYAQGVI